VGGDRQAVSMGSDSAPTPELPPRPTPPRPEDCCGGGCVNCIYVIYDDALLAWERDVERILAGTSTPGL
jgi:hypothetical protein